MDERTWQHGQTPLSTLFFSGLHPVLRELNSPLWPSRDALNRIAIARNIVNQQGHPIRFVPASTSPALQYESHIATTGEIPTRDNWHDLLNALQWLSYPVTKAAINAQHVARIDASMQRCVARDVLTMFDESGIMVASADESLLALVRDFQWHTLFVTRRADVIKHMRFTLFGHGLLEKSLSPFIGITAKAMLLHDGGDAAAANWLNTESNLAHARTLAPLPLLGIPGWDMRSEDATFYDNTHYFRTGYRPKSA